MKNTSPNNLLLSKQNPTAKAIISSEINYTFAELKKKVLNTAGYLQAQKISPSERVGIISQNGADFIINVLALWQISAIPVPINLRLNYTEIVERLDLANCKVVLIENGLSNKIKITHKKLLVYPFQEIVDHSYSGKDVLELNDPAVIIFTSGSTNNSKGIILSFNSLYNSAINSNHLLRYNHSDRLLASLPFYHIGGFSIITRSLHYGIPIIIPDSLSIEDIVSSSKKWQPTIISLVAAQLKKFVDEGISPNPEMKNCLIGGGFSDVELLTKAYDLGWPVNKVYGSTETSSFVTALLKDELIFKPHSVGRAVPTNRIQISDSDGNELKPFEIGEIAVQSNSLMSGYLDENQTKQVIKNGYYFTGDFGYNDEEGYLFVEGRKNYLISTGGENVNPIEIEKVLLEHPLIKEAFVFPLKDEIWGEIISAAIVLKNKEQKLSYDDFKKFLEKKISGFKIPKKIFFEDKLPKTELGKIQKDKLIERYKLTSL